MSYLAWMSCLTWRRAWLGGNGCGGLGRFLFIVVGGDWRERIMNNGGEKGS